MDRYRHVFILALLYTLTLPSIMMAQDFQIRDNNGNAISLGQGRIDLKQRNQRGSVSGLSGLSELRDLQQLKRGNPGEQLEAPDRCIRDVETGTPFNNRERRYGSDVVLNGDQTVGTRNYTFSKSLIVKGDVALSGTGDFRIHEHLIVEGSLLNQGTGDVYVAGDLLLAGNVENRGTGRIQVNGTIYRLPQSNLLNIGTGSISGSRQAIQSEEDISCQ